MSEGLERSDWGLEFTEMLASGPVVPGVPLHVMGTTVTAEAVETWTGCFLVPVEDEGDERE